MSYRPIVSKPVLWVIVALALLLPSCGSKDGGLAPPAPVTQSPSGVWVGLFTSTAAGVSSQVEGVISEDREAQFLSSNRHYSGSVAANGSALTGTLTVYLGATGPFRGIDGVQSISLDGTIEERDRLLGDYVGDEDRGGFNLNYIPVYENPSSIADVSGIWVHSEAISGGALYTVTLDIDASGAIFGGDTNGCVYSGQMQIIDGRYNAYRATVSVSSCLLHNGNYSGLAHFPSVDSGAVTRLIFSISKPDRAFGTILQRL